MGRFDIGSFKTAIRCRFVSRTMDWSRRTEPFIPKRYVFILLTSGERRLGMDGKDWVARPGDLICFSEGQRVQTERAKNLSWKGYRLHYRTATFGNRDPEWIDLPPVMHEVSPEIRGYVRALSFETLGSSTFEKRRSRAYLELLLTSLAGLVQTDTSVRLLEQAIRANLSRNLLLTEAAEHCHVSPATLKRHLKEQRGTTFSQFKHSTKIGIAQQILEFEPERILAEIAEQLGYHDAFHLSRTFKQVTGLSPRDYRVGFRP